MQFSDVVASPGAKLSTTPTLRLSVLCLVCAMLAILAAWPVLTTPFMPLLDYPNHMARMHVLLQAGQNSSAGLGSPLDQFYRVQWRLVPDLGLDLVVPLLARIMPLDWAGRCFILLIMALMVAGTFAVSRMLHGRVGWWPCLSFLFLYDHILLMGFLNYLIGAGLMLLGIAAWLAVRRRAPVLRIAVGTAFAVGLYFAHLFAFGIYGLVVAGYELQQVYRVWRSRQGGGIGPEVGRLAIAAAQFVVPAILLVVFVLILRSYAPGADAAAGIGVGFGKFARKFDLIFSVFDDYDRVFDISSFVVLVLGFVVAVWRGLIRISPAMALPLSLLAIAYFVMPTSLVTAFALDRRMPVAFALLLIAASQPVRWRPGAEVMVASALVVLFTARMALIQVNWQESSALYQPWADALDQLPRGAKLALASPPNAERMVPGEAPFVHFPLIAVARRDAFVPTLFALPTQQPVELRPAYRSLAVATRPDRLWDAFVEHPAGASTELREQVGRYDYVLFLGNAPFHVADDAQLTPVRGDSKFQLFKVRSQP
ncbi:MAG TPA: hypothetical protein VNT30_05610 [Stellaceae bacterium]|nr:hypothetical protein [Stellaceae bacterium]